MRHLDEKTDQQNFQPRWPSFVDLKFRMPYKAFCGFSYDVLLDQPEDTQKP